MIPPIFRRCNYPKCKTGLPGLIIPVATFLPKPIDGQQVPKYMPRGHAVMADLRLCESCALTADVNVLVNDKRWTDICHQIAGAGGTPPDRDSLKLELGSPKDQPIPKIIADGLKRMRSHN